MTKEEIERRLQEAGTLPNKIRGQNFLVSDQDLSEVAEAAEIYRGIKVLEIGPGVGNLTDILLARGAEVTAVEIDEKFATFLINLYGNQVNVVHSDILHFDENTIQRPYVVVGNIPYYITGKIVRKFLESQNKPEKIVLTVQCEVAERMVHKEPKSSLLSCIVRLYADVKIGALIPKEHFWPSPKVDSAIVVFDVKKEVPSNVLGLIHLIKIGFAQPRKTLKNNLKNGLGVDNRKIEIFLEQNNFSDSIRPHELSLDAWKAVYSEFCPVFY